MNTKKLFLGLLLISSLGACRKESTVTPLSPPLEYSVSGKVECISGSNIAGADVALDLNGKTLVTKTDDKGNFTFDKIPSGTNLSISATYNTNDELPLTTLSVVQFGQVVNSILAGTSTATPLEKSACDINGNGALTSADVIDLKKAILIDPVKSKWIVISEDYNKGLSTKVNVEINNLSTNQSNIKFVTTRLADPKGNYCK